MTSMEEEMQKDYYPTTTSQEEEHHLVPDDDEETGSSLVGSRMSRATTQDDDDDVVVVVNGCNGVVISNGRQQQHHSNIIMNNGIGQGDDNKSEATDEQQQQQEEDLQPGSSLPAAALLLQVNNGNNNNNNIKKKILFEEEEEKEEEAPINIKNDDSSIMIMSTTEEASAAAFINSSSPNPPLVLYDNAQGKWKCRICTWTSTTTTTAYECHHQIGSVSVHHNHTAGQLQYSPLNNPPINKTCFYFQHKPGTLEPTNGITVNAHDDHIHHEINSQPTTPTFNSSTDIQTHDHDLIINEDEPPEVDLDVENVLQNQTTHDLFCPNCKSCITTRVILRKRKRSPRVSTEEPKRNKTGPSVQAEGGDTHQLPQPDDEEHNMEPDVFRCLSCFSFFIPTGNGFKLFRKFGDKHEKQTSIVGDEQVPNVRKNWFSFIFQSNNKQETAVEQGGNLVTDQRQDRNVASSSSSSNRGAKVDQSEAHKGEKLKESKSTPEVNLNYENDPSEIEPPKRNQLSDEVSAEETMTHSHGELKLLVSSDNGHATSEEASRLNQKLQFDDDAVENLPTSFSAFPESNTGEKLSISVAIPHEEQQGGTYILTESVVENKNTTFASTQPGEVHPSDVSQQIITKTRYEVHTGETLTVDNISSVRGLSVSQGKDTVITIDTRPAESSQMLQGLISPAASASALHSGTHITVGNPERIVEGKQIEVIKSIVYGGLAESITSLSVVSSAAGGGAATLNILALGMANLIGGLFIICHNLWELRCDRIEQVTNQITEELTNEKDRYMKLLGRRENFILHSVVAVISYLIFGLVPPAVYGLSFRKSDDKEFKLLAVASASLVSILILAVGKAYVQRPPKHYIKCVLSFVMLGFMVSGVSYAAGILVERLLEKLHLFEPSPITNLMVPEMTGANSAWSAY